MRQKEILREVIYIIEQLRPYCRSACGVIIFYAVDDSSAKERSTGSHSPKGKVRASKSGKKTAEVNKDSS